MVFFSMVTIKVVCQVGSLLDTYDSQCTQIYHSFTVYLKGANPSTCIRIVALTQSLWKYHAIAVTQLR